VFAIDDVDRASLLLIAREAIVAHVSGRSQPVVAAHGFLSHPAGAFVTLRIRGELRGCIGHVEADRPVGQAVAQSAIAACSADPRFPGVTASELPDLDLEVSILGPLERVASSDDIDVGRHGLVIERGWQRGLLLPQVATEHEWDRGTFVEQTCRKAGLPADAWERGATLWKFEAEVFGEPILPS
jgi:AmmeMemoRadiSam system protein A